MIAQAFEFILGILADAEINPETVETVEKIFDFIVSLFVAA